MCICIPHGSLWPSQSHFEKKQCSVGLPLTTANYLFPISNSIWKPPNLDLEHYALDFSSILSLIYIAHYRFNTIRQHRLRYPCLAYCGKRITKDTSHSSVEDCLLPVKNESVVSPTGHAVSPAQRMPHVLGRVSATLMYTLHPTKGIWGNHQNYLPATMRFTSFLDLVIQGTKQNIYNTSL